MPAGLFVYFYPVVLAASFASLIVLLALNSRALAAACHGPRAVAALFVVALILRLWLSPRAHQVYFDEFEHLDVASNLARGGALARTLVGGRADVTILTPTLWPGGWHLLLGGALRLTGFVEGSAFALNALLGALTVPLLAFAGALLLRDRKAGLLGAALLCAQPVHLQYSGAGDTTIAGILSLVLVLACAGFHLERGDARSYWLLLAGLAWAPHARVENALLLPLAFVFPRQAKFRPLALGALSLSLFPVAALLWRNRAAAVPGFADSAWAMLAHAARNAPVNFGYLLDPRAGLFLIALAGWALARAGRERREARLLAALSGAYFLLYSAYHLGRFPESSQSRYALAVIVPLLPLAGLGLSKLPAPALAVLLGLFGLSARAGYTAQSSPLLAREEAFLRAAATLLPEDAFVVAVSPAAVLAAARRPAISADWCLSEPEACAELRAREGELILLKDFLWHLREREFAPLEAALREEYGFTTLAEAELDRKTYGFYRLTRRGVSKTRESRPLSAKGDGS